MSKQIRTIEGRSRQAGQGYQMQDPQALLKQEKDKRRRQLALRLQPWLTIDTSLIHLSFAMSLPGKFAHCCNGARAVVGE